MYIPPVLIHTHVATLYTVPCRVYYANMFSFILLCRIAMLCAHTWQQLWNPAEWQVCLLELSLAFDLHAQVSQNWLQQPQINAFQLALCWVIQVCPLAGIDSSFKELVFTSVFVQWVATEKLIVLNVTSKSILLEHFQVFQLLQVCSLSCSQRAVVLWWEGEGDKGERRWLCFWL